MINYSSFLIYFDSSVYKQRSKDGKKTDEDHAVRSKELTNEVAPIRIALT
jgi:hypothetical protein